MVERILKVLRSYRFAAQNESDLQAAIASALDDEGVEFVREHNLTERDRIDFLVGRVGIEVKVGGSSSALIRQVHRYAQSEELDAIIVVTTRTHHEIPAREINGRKVVLYKLWESAF